jgi:uncharacterized protein
MTLEFEWHENKSASNRAKHGVSFDEAKTVFNDPFTLTQADPDHSIDEDRWLEMGLSTTGRLLVVWYTFRAGVIRIIGARVATPAESRRYVDERS